MFVYVTPGSFAAGPNLVALREALCMRQEGLLSRSTAPVLVA
jgi:hypothetical protein